jgi:glutamyl-tRNA synthetase
MNKIRTRFAPSPTGYIHVGNVRTALFAWILARQSGGTYIIRIEDTDQQRYVKGATELIYETLKWLDLDWDEGPDIGGSFGPYTQSERKNRHLEWANQLIDKGLAYADPYTQKEVESFRQQAKDSKKAFLYRDYRPENPPKWDGTKPLRFKVNNPKRFEWDDPILGHLSAGPEALDDFILIKSDGMATYNFAHIVDDADMGITHVIRGLEYVSSTPKYLSLYEALGLKPPVLICMPHIMAPDGKKKLGKRDGAKSVVEYRDHGILPEAMMNFLVSLGWNDGTEQEIFTKEEILKKFNFERVQKSGANFDEQKLIWMNGQWIRSLKLEDLYKRCEGFWPSRAIKHSIDYKKEVLKLVQDRLKTLSNLAELTNFFFEEPEPNLELITNNEQLSKLSYTDISKLLDSAKVAFSNTDFSKASVINDTLNNLLEITGQKPAVLFSLIRIATTWAPFSPSLAESLAILGKDKTIDRIQKASLVIS